MIGSTFGTKLFTDVGDHVKGGDVEDTGYYGSIPDEIKRGRLMALDRDLGCASPHSWRV